MKIGEPIKKVMKYSPPMPKINLCCIISEKYGNIYNHYSTQYFSSADMTEVLKAIRERIDIDEKAVLFWDNASIHKSEETKVFAARPDIDIELCRNIRYRCDLNPCEMVFRKAKYNYSHELERYKSLNHIWDNEEVVKYIMN